MRRVLVSRARVCARVLVSRQAHATVANEDFKPFKNNLKQAIDKHTSRWQFKGFLLFVLISVFFWRDTDSFFKLICKVVRVAET